MKVLIAEDDRFYSRFIAYTIQLVSDTDVDTVFDGEELLRELSKGYDVLTLDYNMPGLNVRDLIMSCKRDFPTLSIIVISGQEDISIAIDLLSMGVSDYLVKNESTKERLLHKLNAIKETIDLKREVKNLETQLSESNTLKSNIIGKSAAFQDMMKLGSKASNSNINVMLSGETGTGKEQLAKAIHYNSDRKKKPFIAVNLASLPETLIESELFGFVKGAFTGADFTRKGKFEEAGAGTIFLDEIADVPHAMQVKLLRVLQEREISKVGSNEIVPLQCRIITATHKDLAKLVEEGSFREDLYYRIKGLTIICPPLRERINDVPLLTDYFIAEYQKENRVSKIGITREAIVKLMSYDYPGNIRELKSIIELACVMKEADSIEYNDIVLNNRVSRLRGAESKTLKEITRDIIAEKLEHANNNVRKVAKELGIGKSTIYRILKEENDVGSDIY